jgi:hypothetical protein
VLPPDPGALLAALPLGARMRIEVRGRSMWPVLWPGDALLVERCAGDALGEGDLAVLARSDGALICHGVIATRPLTTAGITGTVDAALEPIARAVRIRRGRFEWNPRPGLVRAALALYPRLPGTPVHAAWKVLVAQAASPLTADVRRALLKPRVVPLTADDEAAVAIALSRWVSPPAAELTTLLREGRATAVRTATGLGGFALVHGGVLRFAHLRRRLRGLGLERELLDAVVGSDVTRAEVDEDETGFREALTALGIPVAAPSHR